MTGASIETTLELWASSLREVKARMRPLFSQTRVAASANSFLDGLLGDERRKTGWMRAEAAGDAGPWRQQAILGRGRWDADALRDIVRKANAANKSASLCGEMASKPLGALVLIALGYRSLSLSATGHGPVKAMILDLDAKKAEATLMPLLDAPAGSVSIRQKLTEFAEAEGLYGHAEAIRIREPGGEPERGRRESGAGRIVESY